MKKLLDLKIYRLLEETSKKIENTEIKNAYDDFVVRVIALSSGGEDILSTVRELNFIRIEFIILRTSFFSPKKEDNILKKFI
jgi:hypothetical protein